MFLKNIFPSYADGGIVNNDTKTPTVEFHEPIKFEVIAGKIRPHMVFMDGRDISKNVSSFQISASCEDLTQITITFNNVTINEIVED